MSKDPAILFYTSDFLSGTVLFNDAQTGQYIILLCHQHQIGHLPEDHMINICGSLNNPVLSKFEKDRNGNYYNKRLEEVIIKRKNYSKSRSQNRRKKGKQLSNIKIDDKHVFNICNSYDKHMENENGNENKDKNKDENKKKYNPISDCPFFNDEDFKDAWLSWDIVRTKKKCSNSDRAIKAAVNKLMKLSKGDKETAIKILDKSAYKGYSDLYELEEQKIENLSFGERRKIREQRKLGQVNE